MKEDAPRVIKIPAKPEATRHTFESGEEPSETIRFIFFIPQRSILLCRKPEDQPFGAVLVDWLLFQSIIQRLLRFGMCGWRRTALMLYAFRVICETVEQAGDTLFYPLRWRCTTEPAQDFLGFRLFRKLWLVGAFFVC